MSPAPFSPPDGTIDSDAAGHQGLNSDIPETVHDAVMSDMDTREISTTSEEPPTSMPVAVNGTLGVISVGVDSKDVVDCGGEEDSISQFTNEETHTAGTNSTSSSTSTDPTSRGPSPSHSSASSVADECASEHVIDSSLKEDNATVEPPHLEQENILSPEQETICNDDATFSVFTQDFHDLPRLCDSVISAPVRYVESTPGKKIRDKAASALNVWLQVEDDDLKQIRRVIDMLHNASLILDDVEDGSATRRGRPATHKIFGTPQAINSAGYQINRAMMEVLKLGSSQCLEIFMEELDRLYIGQGYDLFWTFNIKRPSVEKYISMVDYKTGSLFNMLVRLMSAKTQATSNPGTTTTSTTTPDLNRLVVLLGRYFQIRDDYMNLTSEEYTVQKGFCDDLDEGKFSLTLVHALEHAGEAEHSILRHVLAQRQVAAGMSLAQKHLVIDIVKAAGSLQYTVTALRRIGREIDAELDRVEAATGVKNKHLRMLVEVLRV